jgi:hypothetical protein
MRVRRFVVLGIAVLLVLGVTPSIDYTRSTLFACWSTSPFPTFLPTREPDDERFYSGRLGVLQSGYNRSAMVAAWRTLSGRPLVEAERQASLHGPSTTGRVSAREVWMNARGTVPGSQGGFISQETFLAPTYTYILNCGDSALLTAAKTLDARRASLGAASPEFFEWVTAQDMVFSNCARQPNQPPAIPQPLGPTASVLARADRAYQIAAAQFYSGQLTEAEAGFTAISHDGHSPWQRMGSYLAARAMIRQATIGGKDSAGDPTAADRARNGLKAVIADPALSEMHASAEGLLQYLDARDDPVRALQKVASAIEKPESNGEIFAARLNDFRILMRHLRDRRAPESADALAPARQSSELVDWLATLESASPRPEDHAIARWDATRSPAWLAAALMTVELGHARQGKLLDAAAQVPSTSPAYLTLAFHRGRLLLLSGDLAEARAVVGRALASPDVPASTANLLKAQRLLTARTLREFLEDALRTPILERGLGAHALDTDSIDILNEQLPLEMLRQIASDRALPAEVRTDILHAAFTRAVLLRDAEAVRQSVPALVKAQPELRAPFTTLNTASDDQILLDEAMLVLLAHPGLRPFVATGSGRRTTFVAGGEWRTEPLSAIDNVRDNWWCGFATTPEAPVSYETQYSRRGYARQDPVMAAFRPHPNEADRLVFLSDAQRGQAADEWTALQRIDTAPNELGRWATKWVEDHRSDPRAPKVLYQIVRATRYGCTDARTGAISRRAFTLLHSRYGTSEWAKKAPHWFN